MQVVTTVLVLACILPASSDVNHWEAIKPLLETPQRSAELREYLEPLTANDLIVTAKLASAEIASRHDPEDWDVAMGGLGFFYQAYPTKSNNLADIATLLTDLNDKKQASFWRYAIMELLSSWKCGRIGVLQSLDAAEIMREIYGDRSEDAVIRVKAIRKSSSLLLDARSENLLNDPNVTKWAAERKLKRMELLNEAKSGNIALAKDTRVRDLAIRSEIAASTDKQMKLFEDKSIGIPMQESIIVCWVTYYKDGLADPEITSRINQAMSNYRAFPEELWPLLATANIEDLGSRQKEKELGLMMNDVQDSAVRKRLSYLRTKHFKKML